MFEAIVAIMIFSIIAANTHPTGETGKDKSTEIETVQDAENN